MSLSGAKEKFSQLVALTSRPCPGKSGKSGVDLIRIEYSFFSNPKMVTSTDKRDLKILRCFPKL